MSSQPAPKIVLLNSFSHPKNHLDLGGEAWQFAPAITAHLKDYLFVRVKTLSSSFGSFARKTAVTSNTKALNRFISDTCPVAFFGDQKSNLYSEFLATTCKTRRIQSEDQTLTNWNEDSFTLYQSIPAQIISRQISNKAAFALNPTRPDLINVLTNCLQRDATREFLLADHWTAGQNDDKWIKPNKLKLHLASLHQPKYLIVRTHPKL